MKNILLTHSYLLRHDPKQWKTGLPYPPLGTLYAASVIREAGYNVSFFDSMFIEKPEEISLHLREQHPDIFVIYDDGFNYLTKMCLTNMREAAFRMIAIAKEKGCTVIISSSDSTDHADQYLDAGADYVLAGEAEQTLLELILSLDQANIDLSIIQGIIFRINNETKNTGKRDVLRDLDSLPLPAWDMIDLEPYRQSWIRNAGYFSINLATTRGCPYKCNWCAKPIYGNRYNSRSPENVVKEIKWLKEKTGFDHIWFCDDIFGLKPGWVASFAGLLEKENISIRFKIQCRADLLVNEKFVNDLARAGCENIWIGAESGSQKILDAMDKGITPGQVGTATRLLKKSGIKPSFFIQFGYPGETMDDIEMTIRMINELLPWEIGISISYPLPGTTFYKKVEDQLKEKSNWTDSDELQLMFRNTYSPSFYRQLHRYVHKNYHKHLAIEDIRRMVSFPASLKLKIIKKTVAVLYYLPAVFFARKKLKFLSLKSA